MTIEQRNNIDFISTDSDDGSVILSISDHLAWDEKNAHLMMLQEKVNEYLKYIESEEIYNSYPDAKGKPIKIIVFLKHDPTDLVKEFFRAAQEVCRQLEVSIEYEMIE
ncbi:MAG: hypothetical protein HQM13_04095 [SAR324 cluster bacterium]|nr:hypothetical protein [SAR324 cluster bacterium]